MLHCDLIMKITNEKRGIFAHFIHTLRKQNSVRAISITMDSMFPLKVLIINKSEDTRMINISKCTL